MKVGPLKLKPELSDLDRLRGIVQTFRDCGADVTQAAVMRQFRYETGHPPRLDEVRKACK